MSSDHLIQFLPASAIARLASFWLGEESGRTPNSKHKPRVEILPNVTEVQWSDDGKDTNGETLIEGGTEPVLRTLRSVLGKKVDIALSSWAAESADYELWSGNAGRFLKDTLPKLPRNSIVVSHGLFMQLRLCRNNSCSSHVVPNGGVLCVVCRNDNNKLVFIARHCPTCDNVNRFVKKTLEVKQIGQKAAEHLQQSARTMCVSLEPLQPLMLLVKAMNAYGSGAYVFCSPLPRAIVTAASLVSSVTSQDLRELQKKFASCPIPPTPKEVEAYLQEKTCCGELDSPFC